VTALVHIVGTVIDVGTRTRQCCAWCGETLLDYDQTLIAVPVGQDSAAPATFPPGALLEVDGGHKTVIDGNQLPDNACPLVNLTAVTEQRALDIADQVAAEEPAAGAARVTRRLLAALLDAGLVARQINQPLDFAQVLERQFGFDLTGRTLTNVRSSVSDYHEFFLRDQIRFRIEGDLVRDDEVTG
jgi:hypothetical protein